MRALLTERTARRRAMLTRVTEAEQATIVTPSPRAARMRKGGAAAAVRGVLLGETGVLHLGKRLTTDVPPQLERLGRMVALSS